MLIRIADEHGAEPPEVFLLDEIEGLTDDEHQRLTCGEQIMAGGGAGVLFVLTPVEEE